MMRRHCATWLAPAVLLLALAASAATPGQINYQGLLLDDQGDPVTGNVDLVFTIFDADAAGTPLWTEAHPDVPALDGVYDVLLGETTPITPAVVAGGVLYLEIEVEGETLSPRQRLVAVPYALHADTADAAATVGGFDSAYFMQVIQHFDFDGGAPPNDDPSEGVLDADADGLANFIDSDNDDDGLSDTAELAQASDINLITPTIASFSPEPAEGSVTTAVTITGTSFEPGMAVSFGGESPTPQNVTPTSLEVDVGPRPAGTVAVQVTRSNGQSASSSFQFASLQPTIASVAPSFLVASQSGTVTVSGSGFAPGLQVGFGSENPVPQNVTPASFEVAVGPQGPGLVSVTVSYPSGLQDSADFVFEFVDTSQPKRVFATSTAPTGNMGGVAGANAICAARAAAASLSGTYLAWLGDATSDPATSFSKSFPYVLVDGSTVVAQSFLDLTDGQLDHAIDRNEFGSPVAGFAWTNVKTDGTLNSSSSGSCSDWTSAAVGSVGLYGELSAADGMWTQAFGLGCNAGLRLYCFEQ